MSRGRVRIRRPRPAALSGSRTWHRRPTCTTAVVEPATSSSNRVTAYSYDAANRPVDAVAGADNLNAGQAGLVDANGGVNARTRVAYDADGHVVAKFLPDAF